jgi:putative membrane protein
MKKLFFISALAASSLAFQACNRNPSQTTSTSETKENSVVQDTSKTSVKNTETSFVEEAATGGMMEVTLGKLALMNASNDKVKKFGMMMVTDHTKANEELMKIADKMKVTLPKEMMPKQEQMVSDLKSKKGAEFDKAYMDMMVNDHNEDIALFENEAKSSNDPMLKDFATATLPVLRKHLSAAKSTYSDVK